MLQNDHGDRKLPNQHSANQGIVIAVDGPAASGKGTLAKEIAERLGLRYLDTGAIYRAVGYKVLSRHIAFDDEEKIIAIAQNLDVDDIDYDTLYQEGVGMAASVVSAIPGVRKALLEVQQQVANSPEGAVLDGRDIGTVICPNADFKFFITAEVTARAQRRYKQLQNKGISIIYDEVLKDLKKRDDRDSKRAVAPLMPAKDAIHIDTTGMGAQEVLDKVLKIIQDRLSA